MDEFAPQEDPVDENDIIRSAPSYSDQATCCWSGAISSNRGPFTRFPSKTPLPRVPAPGCPCIATFNRGRLSSRDDKPRPGLV